MEETLHMKKFTGQKTEKHVAGMPSLPHCQLPDKNSRDISWDIWSFSRHFKMFMYSFH
jgi:hypothetical protein